MIERAPEDRAPHVVSEDRRDPPPYTPWQPEPEMQGATTPLSGPARRSDEGAPSPGAAGDAHGSEAAPAPGRVREEDVIAAICNVFDPEIPVNIYELGLIYAIDISEEGDVKIEMTLTAPACPSAQELPGEVEAVVSAVPGVRSATVEVVWDPPWDPSRMSDEARLVLGMF
jgi:FeS assembly SUF system protein